MRKRPFLIVAGAFVTLVIIVGLFVVFSSSAELVVTDDPFGGFVGESVVQGPEEAVSGAGVEIAPRLIRITDKPVAEGVVVINVTATTTSSTETATGTPQTSVTASSDSEIRFIDRASGNVYRYRVGERSLVRTSNKTLPGIQQASWLPDGSVAFVRFIQDSDQVATYVLPESSEAGFFLEQNLAQASAVGSSSLFTLLSGSTGSVGSLAKSDGTGSRTLFTSLLSAIVVHPTRGNFYAHTKASVSLSGYAFQISSVTGAFTRVLGPLRGLSVLPSPDGKLLLYSYTERGTLRLAVLDTETRAATALPVATLSEKCTWSPGSTAAYCGVPTGLTQGIPDQWYQGAVAFSDRLWRVDMEQRLATLVIDPSAVAEVSIDAVELSVDPQQDVLSFIDRRSGSLWVYDL